MSVGRINLALVILAVAIVLLPAAEGYAVPTGSSTTVINNDSQVSAGYFTVSLFLKDGEGNYNPISATVLNRGAIGYNENGGNKTLVDGTYPISVSSLYMMITEYNVPYSGTHTYSASSAVTLTDDQTPISGISSSIVLKDGEDQAVTDLVADTYYKIELSMIVSGSSQFTGSTLSQQASIIVTINDSMNSTITENSSVQLSEIVVITPGFEPADIPDDRSDDYGNHDAISVVSDDGDHNIADEDGKVNVTFTVPSGKEFVVRLIPDGGKARLLATVQFGDNTPMAVEFTINGNVSAYVCYDGSSKATTRSGFNAIGNSNWFNGSGLVTVTVSTQGEQHSTRPVQMDVIFK